MTSAYGNEASSLMTNLPPLIGLQPYPALYGASSLEQLTIGTGCITAFARGKSVMRSFAKCAKCARCALDSAKSLRQSVLYEAERLP
jgi:hypothetical protein